MLGVLIIVVSACGIIIVPVEAFVGIINVVASSISSKVHL